MMRQAKENIGALQVERTPEVLPHPVLMQRRVLVLLDKTDAMDRQILRQLENLAQLLGQMAAFFPSEAVCTIVSWVEAVRGKMERTRAATVEGVACRTEALLGLTTLQKALASAPENAPDAARMSADLIRFPR